MPRPVIKGYDSVKFDRKIAQQRLDAFYTANPDASMEELVNETLNIISTEAVIYTRTAAYKMTDGVGKSPEEIEAKVNEIRENALGDDIPHDAKFFKVYRGQDHEALLALYQNTYGKKGLGTSYTQYTKAIKDQYIDALTPLVNAPNQRKKVFESWKEYDKALFAPVTNGKDAYVNMSSIVDRETSSIKTLLDKWQKETDEITIPVPKNLNSGIVEFAVFGELMKAENLSKLDENTFKIGSTIIGEQDLVSDLKSNFFSQTIDGDGRVNMQMIRGAVPEARKKVKNMMADPENNMTQIKENLSNAYRELTDYAIGVKSINTSNFVYPVKRAQQLLSSCKRAGIKPEDIGVGEADLQKLDLLSKKVELVERIHQIRKDTGNFVIDYAAKGTLKDPLSNAEFKEKYYDYLTYEIINHTIEKELYNLSDPSYEAVPKGKRAEASRDRQFTFTEKLLLEDPDKLFKMTRNRIVNSPEIKSMIDAEHASSIVTCSSGLGVNLYPNKIKPKSDLEYFEKHSVNFALDDMEKNLELFEKLPGFKNGSNTQVKEDLKRIKDWRAQNAGNLSAEECYQHLKDDYHALNLHANMTVMENATLMASREATDFNLKNLLFSNYFEARSNHPKALQAETDLKAEFDGMQVNPQKDRLMSNFKETYNSAMADKWWDSFYDQLKENGLDPDNPSVLAHVMVNNPKPYPTDANGTRIDFGEYPESYEAFNTFISKMDELRDPFSYAFMESKNGQYKHSRPVNGNTVEWMHSNMKSFKSASQELKENMFKMAKENRLILRDPGVSRDNTDEFSFVKVGDDGNVVISKTVKEINKQGYDPTQYGFSSKEDFEKACGEIDKGQRAETALNLANYTLIMSTDDKLDDNNLSASSKDYYKNKTRSTLMKDHNYVEKVAAYTGLNNPEKMASKENRLQYDLAFKFNMMGENTVGEKYLFESEKAYKNQVLKEELNNDSNIAIQGEKAPNAKIEAVSVDGYKAEIQRLYKDLQKTDSRFSRDTQSYKDLQSSLSILTTANFESLKLNKAFPKDMQNMLKATNAACKKYMDTHKDIGKLSDRQQRRLKVMHRLMDLTDNTRTKVFDPRENKLEKLANKLVQNQLILNQKKGNSQVAEQARNILLDHKLIKQEVNNLMENPNFKAFASKPENLQKMLETNGQTLAKQFNDFVKTRQLDNQAPQLQ